MHYNGIIHVAGPKVAFSRCPWGTN